MDRASSGIVAIVAGNLLLLAAGAWFGWNAIHCLIVYWLESWLLLPLTLIKIRLLMARGGKWNSNPLSHDSLIGRIWQVLTFCIGFALVTHIAGIFVFGILPMVTGMSHLFEGAIGGTMAIVTTVISRNPAILAAVLFLAAEHVVLLLRDSQSDGGATFQASAEDVAKQAFNRQLQLLGTVIVASFLIVPVFLLIVNGVFGKLAAASISLISIALLVLLKTVAECVLYRRRGRS